MALHNSESSPSKVDTFRVVSLSIDLDVVWRDLGKIRKIPRQSIMPIPDYQTLMLPVLQSAAKETAEFLSKRIVLIDSRQLTRLMIRYNVGCRIEETLYLKKIDEEFFE